MDSNDGALSFDAYINNTDFKRQIDEMERRILGLTDSTIREADKMDAALKKVGAAVGAYFSLTTLKSLGSEIIKVRGEFQQLEVAFNTMLGSKERADALMSQLVDTAARTPFDLQSVSAGAKQLLAYGTAAEKVNDTILRLGDVAAGLSIPLNDIVYLYGTTQVQGRLYTQDLNQFLNRGIPLVSELAKQFNVAESEVKGLVEAGKVGFPEVEKVIQSLTNEGGMFHNLMAEQSKTIAGQISNLEDAWVSMLNNIGTQTEGVISGSIEVLASLVENYETVLDILKVLVATYGAYKAAIIAVNVAKGVSTLTTSGLTAAETLHYGALVLAEKAQKLLNKTMLANPYVAAATLLVGLITSVALFSKTATTAEKAQRSLSDAMDRADDSMTSEIAKIQTLTTVIKSETASRDAKKEAIADLISLSPQHLAGITEETIKTGEATAAIDKYIESRRKQMQLDELNKELDASLKREQEASAGKNEIGWFKKMLFASAAGNDRSGTLDYQSLVNDANKQKNADILKQEAEIQEAIKKRIEEVVGGGNTGGSTPETIIRDYQTVADKIDEITLKISSLEKQRSELNATDAAGIKKINDEIAELNKQKNDLEGKSTGGSTKPTDNPLAGSVDYWQKVREEAVKSLSALSTNDAQFASKQSALLSTIKEAEENINSIEGGQRGFNEQLEYKKKQYQLYQKWVSAINKETADQQFADLIKEGETYVDYLNAQIAELEAKRDSGNITKEESSNLIALLEQRDDATGVKSAIDVFREELSRAKDEAGSLIEYLEILKEKKDQLGGDNSELGIQKKAILQEEENDVSKEQSNYTKQLIAEYKSYAGQRKQIEQNLNKDLIYLNAELEKARKDGREDKIKEVEESIAARKKEASEELKILKENTFYSSESYKQLQKDVDKIGAMILISRKSQIKEEVEYAKLMLGEESEAYQEFMNQLDSLETQGLQNILSIVGDIGSAFDGIGGTLGSIGSALSGIASQAGNLTTAFSKTASTTDKVSAGISGVVTLISMVGSSAARRRAEEEAYYNSIIALQNDYNVALVEEMRLRSEMNESVFVKDYIGRLNDGIASYNEAQKKYTDTLQDLIEKGKTKIGKRNAVDWGNVGTGTAAGAAAGAAIGSVVPVIGTAIGAVVGGVVGFVTGLFGGKKKKDVWGSLFAEYPELIQKTADGEERINKALAEQLINQGLLNTETKELLETALDYQDAMDEAVAQMKEVISDLAGSLGNELRDALVGAFVDGTDAALAWGDAVKGVLEDVLEKMIFSAVFGQQLNKLEEEMLDSFKVGGDGDWIDDFGRFFSKIPGLTEDFYKALEDARNAAAGYGMSLWEKAEELEEAKDPLTGSIRQITEETGSVIAGQVTIMRITTAESLDVARQQLAHLAAISYNTSFCAYLVKLERIVDILEGNPADSLRAKGLV